MTSRYCTAYFRADYIAACHAGRAGTMLRRFELQLPVIPQRAAPVPKLPRPATPNTPVRPTATGDLLLGVIDSGCPFAHTSLRRAAGTRLLAIWDQDEAPAYGAIGGACPPNFGYGAEVHRQALDTLMVQFTRSDALDEEACYRRAGLTGLRRRVSHGAAVLDLLAGPRALSARAGSSSPDQPPSWRPAADKASRADLVFVDLPRDNVQDSSSGGLGRWLLDGLRYICSCAGPKTQHIVITISNGTSRSTHDGCSIIELAMAALVKEQEAAGRTLCIVLPAGNDRDEERHAQIVRLEANEPCRIDMRVPPGSEAPNWVTLRVPPGTASLSLRLRAPGAASAWSPAVGAGNSFMMKHGAGAAAIAGIVFPVAPETEGGEKASSMALIYIGPTESEGPRAAHGDWHIELSSPTPIAEPLHLYICRNQRNPGALARGRQARFVSEFEAYDPQRWRREAETDPPRPASPLRRDSTLNGLSTLAPNKGVVVAGSVFQREKKTPSPYASFGPSAGPAKKPSRLSVDDVAATDQYRGLPGIVTVGSLSGTRVRMKGTSFAAPQVARRIANK